MTVLAIETTGELAELAVVDANGVSAGLSFRHRMDLASLLVPRIEQLLDLARLAREDVAGISVSLGPGSFTGVRIGVATAKGLALALDRPIAGVPTLEVLAAGAGAPPGTLVCPLVDAREGALYTAFYRATEGGLVRCEGEMLLPAAELATHVERHGGPYWFTGHTGPYRGLLTARFGGDVVGERGQVWPRAEWVGWLGRDRLLAGEAGDRMMLAPIYVRPSAAEARWRETLCPS